MNDLITQLLKTNPGGLREFNRGGGCESCGYGSQSTLCVLCGKETDKYADRYRDYSQFGTEEFPHREGCSVPLILAAQHREGLHDANPMP